jgi:CarD family transcriptional regulator
MFEIGDSVVSTTNGICMITDIVDLDLSDNHQTKPYFLLVPFTEKNAKVYIPIDGAEKRIRRTMNREQAMDVIRLIGGTEELSVKNEKERELRYKEAIRSSDPLQLVMIIKNLHRRKAERLAAGKKCTSVDERYYKIATHNLHAELAFALDCTEAEVGRVIQEYVENGKTAAV